MKLKTFEPLGGGVHQLNNRFNYLPIDLQLFADTLNYTEADNPYEFYLNKHTWTKGNIKKEYNLYEYYQKIPNYSTITTIPEENANYIKEALPNVTSCDSMLYMCKALASIDTTGWDTSKVTNMSNMFRYCEAITKLDVSNWNTSNVTDMSSMFYHCKALTTLDVSNWDTSNVTDMDNMFATCNALRTLDLSNCDTSKVTDMGWMFYNCISLTTITGVIDMKSCTSYGAMFLFSNKLIGVKIKNPPSGFTDDYASEISSGKIVIVQ